MKKAKDIINDPIKATLFGKFYEAIIKGWLMTEGGFTANDGKPRVYWKDVESKGNGEHPLNKALRQYHQSKKYFCTPDGFLQRDGRNYIWEAKNWPFWTGGQKPLDQLRDTLFSMPVILTTKAVYRTDNKDIDGFLFSWWSKPEGAKSEEVENLVKEVNDIIAPQTFKIFYTNDILEDCIQKNYSWYSPIIEREEARMKELFEGLHGQ
jgi:hypothetical protein